MAWQSGGRHIPDLTRRAAQAIAGAAFLLTQSISPALAAADSAQIKIQTPAPRNTEARDRDVDRAALQAQASGIEKIKTLLKRYRGKAQEPTLLVRLGEAYQQSAEIQFRVAHGIAQTGGTLKLDGYHQLLRQAIATYSELIGKYPGSDEIAQVYFRRGKSYEELGDKRSATRDYEHLVGKYPDLPESISAYMSLAEFRIEATEHAAAIRYLEKVEKHPESPQYPFALFKLGWAHYNLKNIPRALSYAETHVAYYNAALKSEDPNQFLSTSDYALRENMLLDATVFYNEGHELKLDCCSVQGALAYLRKLEQGNVLGRMLVRLAKLLRSHGHDQDLAYWMNEVLTKESARPEALDVLLVTYEHQLNRRRYPELVKTAQQMIPLYAAHSKYENFAKAQKMLLDTAEQLQQIVVKNKKATGVTELSQALASIYDTFTRVVEETDLRIPRVHYNLAETLFEIRQFEQAAFHYRWVVAHLARASVPSGFKGETVAKAHADLKDVELKAIAARYEALKESKVIPEELKPVSLKKNSTSKLEPKLEEWIGWIEAYESRTRKSIDEFGFEAARALYAANHLEDALSRLKRIALKRPEGKYGIPAASLAIDTLIVTEDWTETLDLASDFVGVKAWSGSEFGKRVFAVAADASYKLIEAQYQAKKFADVVDDSEDFLEDYATSARLGDVLTLAGNAALEVKDGGKAEAFFSRLIREVPKAPTLSRAFSARAQILEERYDFLGAARDLGEYIRLPKERRGGDGALSSKEVDRLRLKALILTWLSGDLKALKLTLADPATCTGSLVDSCKLYEALSQLEPAREKQLTRAQLDQAFDRARKESDKTHRTVWATVALEGAQEFPFRDRMVLIRQVAQGYSELEAAERFTLLPYLSRTLPQAFRLNRQQLGQVAPLRADERYITRRIEVIREMENAATKVLKMPWSRIRALVLNEIADTYLDLAQALGKIPAPKSLAENELSSYNDMIRSIVIPFEEKGQEMRAKSFEIASHNAIEDAAFALVAEPFFRDNPAQAQKLKAERDGWKLSSAFRPRPLDLAALDRLDPKADWPEGKREPASLRALEPGEMLQAHLSWAIRNQRWSQVAFYLQEAQDKKLWTPASLLLARAVALAQAGARAEAFAELEEGLATLTPSGRERVAELLVGTYLAQFGRKRSEEFLGRFERVDAEGAAFANATLLRLGWRQPAQNPQISPTSVDAKKKNK